MSQVVREVIPRDPFSLKGMSTCIQVAFHSIFSDGLQGGSLSVILLLIYQTILGTRSDHGYCISVDRVNDVFGIISGLFTAGSTFQLFNLTAVSLFLGCSLEARLGTPKFIAMLTTNFILLSVGFKYFFPDRCFPDRESLGPLLASSAALMHKMNPRVYTEALPGALRLAFPVELRWFVWVFLSVLVTFSAPQDLFLYLVGLIVGALPHSVSIMRHLVSSVRTKQGQHRLLRSTILAVSLTYLPFSVETWLTFPWTGPSILHNKADVVQDLFSLVIIQILLLSPIFLILDMSQRTLPFVAVSCVIGWIYCTISPVFVTPGPGLVGLALLVYSTIAWD